MPNLSGRPAELVRRLTEAHRAASSHPTPATVQELARLYHENWYPTEAAACWSWLRAAQPNEAKWAYYLADAKRTGGVYDGLEAQLNETVRLAPDYAAAWLQLAQVQFKTGRFDLARQSYERRLSLLPKDPYARLGLVRIDLQQNHREEARRAVEQLLQDAPKFSAARNLYVEMLAADGDQDGATKNRGLASMAGRFREADDPWLEELHAWCYDPQRLAVLSAIDFQTNHGDRGRAYQERAVAVAPTDEPALLGLANLYLKIGEYERAREVLERALPVLKTNDPVPYVNLCEAYRMLHREEDALREVDQALKKHPEAYQLYNERGLILADLNQMEESASAYREALARNPNDTDSNYSLGITLLALGRTEEGVAFIKQALKDTPTYPRALLMLGKIALDAGNLELAGSYLKPLYGANPEQPMARQLMAAWYLRVGMAANQKSEQAAAEENYRAGFAIDPNNPGLSLNLGTLYLIQGRAADAVAPLEAYKRVKPQDPQGLLFLGQAYAQVGRVPEARQCLRDGEKLATQIGSKETAAYCREILTQIGG